VRNIIEFRKHVASMIGWRYERCGRGPGGIDCFGMFIVLGRALGYDVPDFEADPGNPMEVVNAYSSLSREISLAEVTEGDVVVLKLRSEFGDHIGMCIGFGKFIHCTNAGVAISSLNERLWRSKIVGCYRLVES